MGTIRKAILYSALIAVGFGMGFKTCTNPNYQVVEKEGNIYVEDRQSGKRSKVHDFSISPDDNAGLAKRIEDAYNAFK